MPTLVTIGRLKSAYIVQSAIDEFRGRALLKLPQELLAQPEGLGVGESKLDYGGMLDLLNKDLTRACDKLFATDVAWVTELTGDKGYLMERDELTVETGGIIRRMRSMFDGCYKPPRIEPFGFTPAVSRDPEALFQEARHLDLRLRDADLVLPEPLDPELAIDPLVLLKPLTPKLTQLDELLKHIRNERRRAQIARVDRLGATDDYDRTFLLVTRSAVALFNRADEKELAARVRPSLTRRGRTDRDPDEILDELGESPDFGPVDNVPGGAEDDPELGPIEDIDVPFEDEDEVVDSDSSATDEDLPQGDVDEP